MLNHIDIMGRLCNDPELRHTPSGVPVCTFRIANDTGRKDRDGNRITRFVTCVAWRGSAEFAAKYLAKGRLVVVEGELDVREFTDREGVKRREYSLRRQQARRRSAGRRPVQLWHRRRL